MLKTKINRRDLFRTVTAGAISVPAASYSRILGANDRIHVGVVGYGIRGSEVMPAFQKSPKVVIAAVCDLYGARVDKARRKAPGAVGFSDHRKMLEMKNLDAVLASVTDHWHAGVAIDALNAGKDVYVEKPLTMKLDDGPKVIKAARVNNRVCQVGMQRRSGRGFIEAKREYFDSGKIGKLLTMRSWYYKCPVYDMKAPASFKVKPSNLDWVQYVAPVRWRAWNPQQFWNFRAYFDFGGGQVTDLFIHLVDVLHMFTGQSIPCAAVALGGIFTYKDDRTTPDNIHVALEYPGEYTASFDGLVASGNPGKGMEFVGTKGSLIISGPDVEFRPVGGPPIKKRYTDDLTVEHVNNFLDCMRSRKRPNADVFIGHRSSQAAHLANIAYLQQARIKFDPGREQIVGVASPRIADWV